MKDLKEFDISFVGLREGVHQFEYTIEKKFFDFFNFDDYHNSSVKVLLTFVKTTNNIIREMTDVNATGR